MIKERSSFVLVAIVAIGVGMNACSGRSKSNPLGSSANNNGGGNATASTTLLTGGVYAPWNGITPVEHIQANETIAAGLVDPLTGATSLQLSAKTPGTCLPTTPPSPCTQATKNAYNTNGSYRLATCRPNPGVCPSVNSDWQSPHNGGSVVFDLQIDIPLSDVASVIVSFGNPGCPQTYRIPDATVATTIGNFVRVSIPLSAFSASAGCVNNQDTTIFQLDVSRVGTGTAGAAIMSVDRIIWTN